MSWSDRVRSTTKYNVGATTARMQASEKAYWEMEAKADAVRRAHGIDDDALRVRGRAMTDALLESGPRLVPVDALAPDGADAHMTDDDSPVGVFPNMKMPHAAAVVVQSHPYFIQALMGINDVLVGFDTDRILLQHLAVNAGLCPLDELTADTNRDEQTARVCTFTPVLPKERLNTAEIALLNARAGIDASTSTDGTQGPSIPSSVTAGPETAVCNAADEEELSSILDDSLRFDITIMRDPVFSEQYFLSHWVAYLVDT